MDDGNAREAQGPEIGYHWHPIEDLPGDWRDLQNGEVKGWLTFWREHLAELGATAQLERFRERLAREWSIETGAIEDLYDLRPAITRALIERGFDDGLIDPDMPSEDWNSIIRLLNAQADALEVLMELVDGSRELTVSWIKRLHAVITRPQETCVGRDRFGRRVDIPLLHGEFKRLPNTVPRKSDGLDHEHCPPEHVASEMENLLRWHEEHSELGVPPEVEAAWLHHRFVQIHPFQDGNGRIARCLASLVFLKAGALPTLVLSRERSRYREVLDLADEGDLGPHVTLFAQLQSSRIREALDAGNQPVHGNTVTELLHQNRGVLERFGRRWERSADPGPAAAELMGIALRRFEEIAAEFRAFSDASPDLEGLLAAAPMDHSEASLEEVEVGKRWAARVTEMLGYRANVHSYFARRGLLLTFDLGEEDTGVIEVSFHGYGPPADGVLAAVAYLEPWFKPPSSTELMGGPTALSEESPDESENRLIPLVSEPFVFSYAETRESVQIRFTSWLEQVILEGLKEWIKRLSWRLS